MHGLETIQAMNTGAVAQPQPVTANSVFTVVWQGTNDVITELGPEEVVKNFVTEVIPDQYGYIDIPVFTEVWGAMACGEEHDGDNPYDHIDVIAVLEGGFIRVETEDRVDA